MAEYIDRDVAKDELLSWAVCIKHPEHLMKEDAMHILDSIPAVDVAPVVHGRWEKTEDDFYMGLTIFKCSVCREEWVFEDMADVDALNYHYCPNCGARMDGEGHA